MNTLVSVKVGTLLVISYLRFLFFIFFSLCSPHWFEVGGTQLLKTDVTYFHAPIRIWQHLNQNLVQMLVSCLVSVNSI